MSADTENAVPDGWSAVPLGELFTFKNGLNKGKAFFGHGTPIVNYMDVFAHSGLRSAEVEGLVDVTNAEKKAYSARLGDVLFTRTSETPEEVGVSAVLLDDIEDAVFSGFVLRGRPTSDRLKTNFAKHCFGSQAVRSQIVSSATYTTRALTNGRTLSRVLLPLPNDPHEQHAIAEALTDADGVIAGLERLIAKKRQIKQGAMQDLLTARRRLPGFTGEWDEKQLGKNCRITTGRKDVNEGNPNGDYPFFTCAKEHTYSDFYSFDCTAILIAGNGEVGNLSRCTGKFEAYQRTYVLHSFDLNEDFIWFQLLSSLAETLGIGKIGSSIPYIKKGDLTGFTFQVPRDPKEQSAIATVLSEMDAEIQSLDARLTKARAVKEGMMQVLLTGRVRLV
ncbi:hypothetical protein LCGC14_0510660 [marine sediment metagenome]|uniref:Restriction endonuclease subunit S n=2 Tax=root TaxID=1 RepID=A0A7V1A6X4_9RHOB|nr:restriction endonuclease subunit S [Sulfitobacter litoralis]HDY95479.1 restriction endonuclease subunit S [Sulfitobacter litoralis]HDZ53787.1 restriction endonuclease subunit S [Sulfitobacter litoralis]